MDSNNWLVKRWMTSNLITIRSKDYLIDAFELMQIHNIRHLPVVDGDTLEGMVTDRDVRAYIRKRPDSKTGDPVNTTPLLDISVEQAMTKEPLYVTPQTTVTEAADTLVRRKIGALPVIEDGKPVGIVTTEDLLTSLVEYAEFQLKN